MSQKIEDKLQQPQRALADKNREEEQRQKWIKRSELPQKYTGFAKVKIDCHKNSQFMYYSGEFVDGLLNGLGTIYMKNERKYEGEFKNDLIEGFGKYTQMNGNTYIGEHKSNLAHGFGVLTLIRSGQQIQGQFRFCEIMGFAKHYSSEGKLISAGQFKNNYLNGFGKQYSDNRLKYEGDFVNQQYDGFGKQYYKDGGYYFGQFKKWKRKGFGKQFYFDDMTESYKLKFGQLADPSKIPMIITYRYQGFYNQNQKPIFGRWIRQNGQISFGYHNGFKKHGFCIYLYQSGEIFQGKFKDNKKNGFGKHIYLNGSKYEGFYVEDKRIGFGKFFDSQGKMILSKKKRNMLIVR